MCPEQIRFPGRIQSILGNLATYVLSSVPLLRRVSPPHCPEGKWHGKAHTYKAKPFSPSSRKSGLVHTAY